MFIIVDHNLMKINILAEKIQLLKHCLICFDGQKIRSEESNHKRILKYFPMTIILKYFSHFINFKEDNTVIFQHIITI